MIGDFVSNALSLAPKARGNFLFSIFSLYNVGEVLFFCASLIDGIKTSIEEIKSSRLAETQ